MHGMACSKKLFFNHARAQVETAGDCYIVSGGVMSPEQGSDRFGLVVDEDHNPGDSAKRVMAFAKAALKEAEHVRSA